MASQGAQLFFRGMSVCCWGLGVAQGVVGPVGVELAREAGLGLARFSVSPFLKKSLLG